MSKEALKKEITEVIRKGSKDVTKSLDEFNSRFDFYFPLYMEILNKAGASKNNEAKEFTPWKYHLLCELEGAGYIEFLPAKFLDFAYELFGIVYGHSVASQGGTGRYKLAEKGRNYLGMFRA